MATTHNGTITFGYSRVKRMSHTKTSPPLAPPLSPEDDDEYELPPELLLEERLDEELLDDLLLDEELLDEELRLLLPPE